MPCPFPPLKGTSHHMRETTNRPHNVSHDDLERAWTPSVVRTPKDDPPRSLALTMPEFTYVAEAILLLHSCLKNPEYVFDPKDQFLSPGDHKRNLDRFPFALSLLL